MTQDRQFKKVKKYRTLKVVFYCLGLPLFLVAVFLSAIRFIGSDPFTGNSEIASQLGFFKDINILFTSPALYGVWIALAIWLVIAIVHIILSKTVKARRTRMFSMMVVTLAVMMGTMFGMDSVLSTKIDNIAANAPDGVTVSDYKTQLSYYRTVSSGKHGANMTENLIAQVELLEKVYNVEMEGANKGGVAGNIGNKPVRYNNVIDDEGNVGVDISYKIDSTTGLPVLNYDPNGNHFPGDNKYDEKIEGQEIRLAPDANGNLVINGKTYSHYYYALRRTTKGQELYTWYTKDLRPIGTTEDGVQIMDGIYGKGLYNESGMLSDGWIFSLDNVLKILQDYYTAKDAIESGKSTYYADNYVNMYTYASDKRDAYYNGLIPDANGNYVDPWLKALYNQEVQMTERFSLTRGEIDELIAKVGALLGDNSLFDYLFINGDSIIDGMGSIGDIVESFLGGALSDLFKQLNAGMSFSGFGLTGSTLNTVIDILKTLTSNEGMIVDDLYLTLAYKANDCFGRPQDHLFVGLVRGEGKWYITDDSLSTVLVRNADGTWAYAGVDGSEFVPNVKYYDTREVENINGVWAYKDGSGELGEGITPVKKYFLENVEVMQDGNGNWIYANDADIIIGTDKTPVEKYFVNREVKHELGIWMYVDNNTNVVGDNFVPSQRYFDARNNELLLNAAGDTFYNSDGSTFPAVKNEEGKWIYAGVDGKIFSKIETNANGETSETFTFSNGETMTDMFGNEIVFKTSICDNPATDIILDIDFDDTLLDAATGTYAFDLDTLSAFLNSGLNNLLEKYNISLTEGTVGTIVNLVKGLGILLKDIDVDGQTYTGLAIGGFELPLINQATGKIELDITGILENLLVSMYSYQSSVIKPVWEFYADSAYNEDNPYYIAQVHYANYERALYMATIQGSMMGSTIIGDNLGAGTYPSSFGLQNLASVQQLITDLSYQPVYFPLFALRDMLAFFTGIVILFYFASFVMAQKEEDYASGKLTVRSRKQKKSEEATVIAEFDALELQNAENGVETPTVDKTELDDNPVETIEKPVEEEPSKTDDLAADDFAEEAPVKEKKSLFGKKKKEAVEEPADELATDTLDDFAEETPVKEKKSLFGKKKKEAVEEPADELATDTLDDFAEETPVKEKKSLFGKKKKEAVEEPADELATDTLDDFAEETPVKEKKSLFGKKKKKDDIDEDTALPVSENSDEEVLW